MTVVTDCACDRDEGPAKAGHYRDERRSRSSAGSGFSRIGHYRNARRNRLSVVSGFSRTVIVAAAAVCASCNRAPAVEPAVVRASPTPPPAAAAGSVAHGDHNPHHGGIVMMKGDDLHYEVVLDPAGRDHRVYFTDAIRDDLPASVASDVVLTVRRPGAPDERIAMQIDEAGESWIASGRAIGAPASTTVRLAFTIKNEPYWIDLPFTARK